MRRAIKGRYANIERIRGELGQWEALRRVLPFVLEVRGSILIGLLFTVAWSTLSLGYGGFVKNFVDLAQQQGKLDLALLNRFTLVFAGICLARGILYYGLNYAWAYASHKLAMRLRNAVFAHLQSMSVGFFALRKTGQLMSCLNNDVQGVTSVVDVVQDCISAPLILIGGVGVLFWLNWPLALVSCVCMPAVAWAILRATKRTQIYTSELASGRADVLDLAQETIGAIRVVKSFGNEAHEIQRFRKRSDHVFRSMLRAVRVRVALRPALEALGTLAILAVLWVGGNEIARGAPGLSVGALAWFVLVLLQVTTAAQDVGKISINLGASGVCADRVFTLLQCQSEVREKPDAIELKDVRGRVAFDGVGFAYTTGIPVLAGVSFVIEPGQVVALVGPTGAGKTTIAGLIQRFFDATEGSVTIDGVDVRDCTLRSLRAQIGVVPQDTTLFAGTLRENIAYGKLDATEEEIVAAAKTANAWEFIERMPQGLDTPVGERGVTLSGGQRQRIAIARAVLRDPPILILDEATSSLDTRSESLVQAALQQLMAHRTTLVIAHRLSTVRNAGQILVIKDGRLVESGTHPELLAGGGIYSDLYRTQFRWEDQPGRE